jgi:hypothetical protein
MRGVSRWASRVAPLLAAFLVLGAASAWADDAPTPPTDPPQARLGPPVGVTAQARLGPPVGIAPPPPPDATTEARAQPPVGVITYARASPPVGAPTGGQESLLDMIVSWLQSRISIPNG